MKVFVIPPSKLPSSFLANNGSDGILGSVLLCAAVPWSSVLLFLVGSFVFDFDFNFNFFAVAVAVVVREGTTEHTEKDGSTGGGVSSSLQQQQQ